MIDVQALQYEQCSTHHVDIADQSFSLKSNAPFVTTRHLMTLERISDFIGPRIEETFSKEGDADRSCAECPRAKPFRFKR